MQIGIDLGGTKIEGVVMDRAGAVLARERVPTPAGDYAGTLATVAKLVRHLEQAVGVQGLPVGIGHPGSLSPHGGLLRNSNSVCLNARPLRRDLAIALGREPAMANDANCLAASEAADGAAAGARSAFAVILGTGCGGALVVDGRVLGGANGIAGEWGHNPLPWARPEWHEQPGPRCWCGQHGCIETWLSGPGLAADFQRAGGGALSGEAIVIRAEAGEAQAAAALARYEDRLARALASVINLFDPAVIVLGGGLSRIQRLYRHVPALWDQWVFSDRIETRLVPALHGDASGVRGAAWLGCAEVDNG
jgi:N-acetylglucosamine kinase (EC 2.7.1.59)